MKRPGVNSLQRKIASVMLTVSMLTLVIYGAALLVLEGSEYRSALRREITSIAEITGANSHAALIFDDRKAALQNLSVLTGDSRIVAAALYNSSGKIYALYETENGQGVLPAEVAPPSEEWLALTVQRPIHHDGKFIGTIVVRATRAEMHQGLLRHSGLAVLLLFGSMAAAYVLSSRLGRVLSRPILSLARTAEQVSRNNDFSVRAVKESDDETGILVDQFNRMLEEIGKKSAALKDSEKQLRLITDSLPVLIAYVDSTERYVFTNAGYERWFNLSPNQIRGMHVKELIGDKAYAQLRPYVHTALSGKQADFEVNAAYDAKSRWISSSLIPDIDTDGKTRGYIALISDISDRKRIEDELLVLNEALEQRVQERTKELEISQEQLRRSERLASIGTLAAGIAHEIRNPLNSISLVTQVALRYKGKMDASLHDMFVQVANESKRCATIIRNILLFAKAEETEKGAADINEIIRHASDLARSYLPNSKAELTLHLEEGPLMARLNPTEIEQVIVNLINNAAEASVTGVTVDISTVASGEKIRILVQDTGPGIPPNVLDHIFDPFFSTKRQKGNTGLGLSLSHGIISDHNGTMTVQSEVGHGTTFTIEIPRAAA